MAQVEVSASAASAAAPQRLWELLCDSTRYDQWVDGTIAVTRPMDGPARLGATYGEINPIIGPWKAQTNWTVVEFDPPRRQVHGTEDIQVASEFRVIMEVAPADGGSQVTLTLRGRSSLGPFGALVTRVLESQMRRDNERSVQNLVALAARELG